ncbi:hypothetical protein GN956_G23702 [Arapaima gigas]
MQPVQCPFTAEEMGSQIPPRRGRGSPECLAASCRSILLRYLIGVDQGREVPPEAFCFQPHDRSTVVGRTGSFKYLC